MADLKLGLEPQWSNLQIGDTISCLAEVVIWDHSHVRHLLRSAICKQIFLVEGQLDTGSSFALLNFTVVSKDKGIRLRRSDFSIGLAHQTLAMDDYFSCIETCVGIGAMTQGIQKGGFTVKAKNDLRDSFRIHHNALGFQNFVTGDVMDTSTLAKLFSLHPKSAMLAAGFSCQPWSKLGDARGMEDSRSSSLIAVLRAAYFLRAHSVLLECVIGAKKDPEVVELLQYWCRITGFSLVDGEMHLESLWPSKRGRWWGILVNPLIPGFGIKPFPVLSKAPTVGDILPLAGQWDDSDMDQLCLDLYELNKFEEFGGVNSQLVDSNLPLKTALHGWSCQLIACPCGCRSYPLSYERLKAKGLFGALLPTSRLIASGNSQICTFRHLHPTELAALLGVCPLRKWGSNLRFCICGLGQLASPLHSLWIVSQYHQHACRHFDFPCSASPEAVLWNQIGEVMSELDFQIPGTLVASRTTHFLDGVYGALISSHGVSHFDKGNWFEVVEVDPIVASQDPTENDSSQPSATVDPYLPSLDEWECDWPSCPVCKDDEGNFPSDLFDDSNDRFGKFPPFEISPTIQFSIGEVNTSGSLDKGGPDSKLVSFPPCGGVPGFSSKRSAGSFADEAPSKHPRVTDGVVEISSGNKGSVSITGVSLASSEPACKDFSHELLSNGVQTVVTAAELEVPESAHLCASRIVTVHSWDSAPLSFEVALNSTIGDLLVAWKKLEGSEANLRASSMVGSLLPNHELLTENDVIITPMQKFVDCKCPLVSHSKSPFVCDMPRPRIDLLDFQQGWVAVDEMDFYLSQLSGTGLIAMLPCLDFRSDNLDQNASVLDGHLHTFGLLPHEEKVATAIVYQRHWIPIVLVHTVGGFLVHTTPDGFQLLSKLQPFLSGDGFALAFEVSPMLDVFPADCGFQTFGWIVSHGLPDTNSPSFVDFPLIAEHPVGVKEALRLRAAFRAKLIEDQSHLCLVAPCDLVLGGMGDEIEQNLIRLLESHGVPAELAQHRAFTVLEKLGRSTVSKLLRSSSACKDLKGLANNITPKLQLVLPGELSRVIQDKIANGSAFGDRKTKKQGVKPAQTFLKLRAEDVSIPSSIFKEGNDTPLQQIKIADIGPKARGVIVVNAAQAYPYLKVDLPLSQFGLALLILDHDDTAFHGLGEIIRFPAKYDQTGEPIIATAKLVQLGSSIVSRHFPQTQLRVEEVLNVAIRVLAFRDEIDLDWPSFCEHPIRLILNAVPGLRGKNDSPDNVLDIWDRQFLTLKMERVKTVDAELYVAAFRVAELNLQQVFQDLVKVASTLSQGPKMGEPLVMNSMWFG